MIYSPEGTRLYSPRDLIAYLEGDFAAWCERMQAEGGADSAEAQWGTPDVDEELALLARMGDEHEQRYLTSLRAREAGLVELTRDSPTGDTLAAMRAGVPVIYQAHLSGSDWHGYPDFLVRVAGPSTLGAHHYEAWDTKLALRAKPYFLIQLAAYAELLEAIQGIRPSDIVFVLGNGTEGRFSTHDYYYYYLQLKQSFLDFQADWDEDGMPDPGFDRSWGRWSTYAKGLLAESDHLSLIANISRGQVRRLEDLEDEDITTLCALAGSTVARVPRMSDAVLARLRTQAQLQLASRGKPRPIWKIREPDPEEPRRGLALLPPPSPGDIFFDMEGFPFAAEGLEYLWGAVTLENGKPQFHDWWAHDSAEERRALEQFIDWAWARWREDQSLHIYHYASYETNAICDLMGRYASREAKVDDLLRHGVFVDLYAVVKQGVLVGTPSYSLKEIERLYLEPRDGDVVSAIGSTVQYQNWLDGGESPRWQESPLLKSIRDYNEIDCRSTWLLRDWLLERQRESGIAYLPNPMEDHDAPLADSAEPTPAEQLAGRLQAMADALPEG
ncbi:MAG: TM0106 family RecB-like putative nuclease, partial [Gemmatimonadota bacterium]|nr:TM0106 family RecB-like putative nuclease [Gemmatimonadota bacterium]